MTRPDRSQLRRRPWAEGRRPLRLLAGAVALLLAGGSQAASRLPPLTVVELFQSQGCSSCPPANENANALSDRSDLLVLSYGVTYWDDLGWKDTFASPQFTARQWSYAKGLGHSNVATPQIVLNGRRDLPGGNRAALDAAIRAAGVSGEAEISIAGAALQVAPTHADSRPGTRAADVWLVRYDPRVQLVPIRRGENGGRTLPHRNIVKELVRIGRWSGSTATYTIPGPGTAGLKAAVLVQAVNGGPVLGAAKL